MPRLWWIHSNRCAYTTTVIDRRALLATFRERLVQVIDRSGMTRSQFAERNAARPLDVVAVAQRDQSPPAPRRDAGRGRDHAAGVDRLAARADPRRTDAGRDAAGADIVRARRAVAQRRAPHRLVRRSAGLQDPLRPVDTARSVEDRRRHRARADALRRRRGPSRRSRSPPRVWRARVGRAATSSAATACRRSSRSPAARASGAHCRSRSGSRRWSA